MKGLLIFLVCLHALWGSSVFAQGGEELYIITARDGSVRVVTDYRFTSEHVEYTTKDGASGSILRKDFAKIENMVGVPSPVPSRGEELLAKASKMAENWPFPGLVAIIIACIIFTVRRRRKHSGRTELELTTNGQLSFEYREGLRTSKWVIDPRRGYMEGGILVVEGVCTSSNKLKKFRTDRIVGPVTDLSTGHNGQMKNFFDEK